MWRGNNPYLTVLMYLSRGYNTKQSEVVTVCWPGSDSAAFMFWLGKRAVLLKATYLRCSDIRQPFPGKSGFHISGEVEERTSPELDWTVIFASKDFFFFLIYFFYFFHVQGGWGTPLKALVRGASP